MYILPSGLLIGSRLELDTSNSKNCRIAFWGHVTSTGSSFPPEKLQILKTKTKTGQVERLHDQRNN